MPWTRQFQVRRSLHSRSTISSWLLLGILLAWTAPVRAADRFADQRIAWPGIASPFMHFGATLALAEEGPGYAFVGAPGDGSWCVLERDPMADWTSDQFIGTGVPQEFVVTSDADTLLRSARAEDGTASLLEIPDNSTQIDGLTSPIDAVVRQAGVVAVGRKTYAGERGIVQIYENAAGTWGLVGTFIGGLGDELGAALAIRDSILVAGAPGAGDNGRVHVLARVSGSWIAFQTIESPSTTQTGARFGNAVALAGSWLAIASELLDRSIPGGGLELDAGGVFLYRSTLGFTLDSLVRPSGLHAGAHFGASLAMRAVGETGTVLVAGAPAADALAGDSGAAYLYFDWGDSWKLADRLLDPLAGFADHLGLAIALDRGDVLVGAPDAENSVGDQGLVLAFLDVVPIAYDGFESGDTAGWSAAVP